MLYRIKNVMRDRDSKQQPPVKDKDATIPVQIVIIIIYIINIIHI